jgi:hypothetical protein
VLPDSHCLEISSLLLVNVPWLKSLIHILEWSWNIATCICLSLGVVNCSLNTCLQIISWDASLQFSSVSGMFGSM